MAFTVVCAWCHRTLREGEAQVSHGICTSCKGRVLCHPAASRGALPMQGRLVRTVPVRLLDVSLSGFRVVSGTAVAPKGSGELRLTLGGHVYQDAVRVVRRRGTVATCVTAGEFDWGNRPGAASIRSAVPADRSGFVQRPIDSERRS